MKVTRGIACVSNLASKLHSIGYHPHDRFSAESLTLQVRNHDRVGPHILSTGIGDHQFSGIGPIRQWETILQPLIGERLSTECVHHEAGRFPRTHTGVMGLCGKGWRFGQGDDGLTEVIGQVKWTSSKNA